MFHRRRFLGAAGAAAVGVVGRRGVVRADDPPKPVDLGEVLEAVRKEYKLPGLAAAAIRDGKVIATGAAGVREVGKDGAVTPDDRFGIGSCTKRMTGVLIARLVDAGSLKFETTLAEALPDVKMRDEYKTVTLAQVLTFTGGIPTYTRIGPKLTPILFEAGTPAERRAKFLAHVLNEDPVAKPGGAAHYSNAGYAILAAAAARAGKKEFPELMAEQVFQPLKMTKAGFGRPRSKDRPNEPWLHVMRNGKFEPEPDVDRPPETTLAGAGNVHCTVGELATFAAYELAAAGGNDPLLKPATAKKYQTLNGSAGEGSYAGGAPWLHAMYKFSTKSKLAVAVATNCGSEDPPCEKALAAVKKKLADGK
jgi:CubicO group peptidase (beta-lactamase class C family)